MQPSIAVQRSPPYLENLVLEKFFQKHTIFLFTYSTNIVCMYCYLFIQNNWLNNTLYISRQLQWCRNEYLFWIKVLHSRVFLWFELFDELCCCHIDLQMLFRQCDKCFLFISLGPRAIRASSSQAAPDAPSDEGAHWGDYCRLQRPGSARPQQRQDNLHWHLIRRSRQG